MIEFTAQQYVSSVVSQMADSQLKLSRFTVAYFNMVQQLEKMNDIEAIRSLGDLVKQLQISTLLQHYTENKQDYFEVSNYATGDVTKIKIVKHNRISNIKLFLAVQSQLIREIEHFNKLLITNEL